MIVCIGIGPGDLGYVTRVAQSQFENAEAVAGFDAVVDIVRPIIKNGAEVITMNYRDQTEKLEHLAKLHHSGKQCVLAFMGDVHFSGFQLLERIEHACGHTVKTIPGISSAQVLASRARVCFDETTFLTFHRRGDLQPFRQHLLNALADHRNAIVIPRPWDFMPKEIARFLVENGASGDHKTEVWVNLTGLEATWQGELADCTQDFSDMSIMLIRSLVPFPSQIVAGRNQFSETP